MPVDDVWYLKKRGPDGERLPSKRHGRGKRYRVRWIDDKGQPRTEFYERKADAERKDANVRADLSRGQYVDPKAGKVTVADYADEWRATQLHVDSTSVRVETAVRLHIVPTLLGRLALAEVRPSQVQAWAKNRAAVLAPTTMRLVYGYLVSMFAAAVLDRRIGSSPCVGVRLPDVGAASTTSQRQTRCTSWPRRSPSGCRRACTRPLAAGVASARRSPWRWRT